MSGPALASITLQPHGGGVAAASRLLWRVFRDEWGDDCRLIELVDPIKAQHSVDSGLPARVGFGLRTLTSQMPGGCSWIFFSHISLTKALAAVPRWCRRPYAVFLYGIEAWKPLSPIERSMLVGAELRIAISRFTAERVAALNPDIGPIVVCPLALPEAETATASDSDAPALRPRTVLIVGRMLTTERYKGHDQLIEAWPTVTAQIPDAQLVLVGDGDDLPRLQARTASMGLEASVIFPGFVTPETLSAFYRSADIFAMPSRGEGLGLVYLEAMANRLPCIGSIHDAAREVIDEGITGFLVDQGNVPDLAGRIVQLLRDQELRRRMGDQGYRRYHSRFTYDRFKTRMLGLLQTPFGAYERFSAASAAAPNGRVI
jgi:phosphatidylinositol alpha-1,6-mannosyltransferase